MLGAVGAAQLRLFLDRPVRVRFATRTLWQWPDCVGGSKALLLGFK
jgi:hypothetical protein